MANERTPPPGGEADASGGISPQERQAFQKRADELGRRLDEAKGQAGFEASGRATSGKESAANASALGAAMRVTTELIGGIAVGSGLGYLLDRALGTWPPFFIGGFLLGTAAGFYNVVRASSAIKTGPTNKTAGPSVRDDDED